MTRPLRWRWLIEMAGYSAGGSRRQSGQPVPQLANPSEQGMCAVASLYSTLTAGVTSPARALPNRAAEAYQVATISSLVDGGYHGDTIPVSHPSGSSESKLRRLDVALRTQWFPR
jgi:hypothetical protein